MATLTHTYTTPGTYPITVTDAQGRTGTATFRAEPGADPEPSPATFTGLNPATVAQGTTAGVLELTGTGFADPMTVGVAAGQHGPVTVVSDTGATVPLADVAALDPGSYDLQITVAGKMVTGTQPFTVTAETA